MPSSLFTARRSSTTRRSSGRPSAGSTSSDAPSPSSFPCTPALAPASTISTGSVATEAVLLVEPLGYLDFLGLEARARLVLTDSGGVQEETSALGVPCFTLRDTTERPVTVRLGTNTLLGLRPARIATIADRVDNRPPAEPIPLWDGNAGARAAGALLAFLRHREA